MTKLRLRVRERTTGTTMTDQEKAMTDPIQSAKPPPQQRWRSRFGGLRWLGRAVTRVTLALVTVALGLVLIGVAQRTGWIKSGSETAGPGTVAAEATFTCPMHPQIRQTGEGRCPICGMALVPATGAGDGDGVSLTIDPVARRLIGIRTAEARSQPLEQLIRTVGSIEYDESQLATISAYVDGRIEALYANYVGVPVQENDDLALIYSPELYSAQVEFLTAQRGGTLKRLGNSTNLVELAKRNLIELGLTEEQITELKTRGEAESRVRLRSPIDGTVIEKYAVEGDYVKTGDKIYRIADLSTVWLMLDLYPDDATRIRFGQQVEAEIQSVPGEVFRGRVAFVDRTVDPDTRTVSVRVEMGNAAGKLRPGDYATARITIPALPQDQVYDETLAGKYISPMHPQIIRDQPGDCPVCGMDLIPTSKIGYAEQPIKQPEVVTVPRDAVLLTGNNSVVYVETEPGRFEVRRVTVGPISDDRAVIVQGLNAGEVVATEGNFLIDSQMQLAGNPSLVDPSKAPHYPPGPLRLPGQPTQVLIGTAGELFDRAYATYVSIQQSLAADEPPAPQSVAELTRLLEQLVDSPEVPKEAVVHFRQALGSIDRMAGPLDEARQAFRRISHALLRAAALVRGEETSEQLVHMYCPMVPGGGGDWMQQEGDLINPYWGSEMLSCGEVVGDLTLRTEPVREVE